MMDSQIQEVHNHIRDSYRSLTSTFGRTGGEAVYMRSSLKAVLFPDDDVVRVDDTALPIVADDRIPEVQLEHGYSSNLYVMDQLAYKRALEDALRVS